MSLRFLQSLIWISEVLEKHNLNVRCCDSITNTLKSEFQVRPVLAFKAIEDSSCIAIFIFNSLCDHLNEKFFSEILVVCRIDIWLLILYFLTLLLFLSLSLFSKLSLALFISFPQIISCFFSYSRASLYAVVIDLIKFYNTSLLFLCEEICDRSLARLLWAYQNEE